MTIVLNTDTEVHTIWMVGDNCTFDWLGIVLKQPGEAWEGIYRFRYYNDDRAFDSSDEKRWFTVTSGGDGPEGIVSAMTKVAKLTALTFSAEMHSIFVNGNGIEAAKALGREKWANFKTER